MPRVAQNKAEEALLDFVDCIEATGGIVQTRKGHMVPVADQEWWDLALAYEKACAALEIQPVIAMPELALDEVRP